MIAIDKILDKFVERLQEIMDVKGWTIKQLSDFLCIPRRTVNSWMLKNRVPRVDYIYHIADKLEVTIDYLVGREE